MPPAKSNTNFGRAIAYTQDACLQHRNIAAGGAKLSLERPERLHAVNIGLAALYARLEEAASGRQPAPKPKTRKSAKSTNASSSTPFTIVRSTKSLAEIPSHPAARDVLHIKTEDEEEEERALTYAETLELWCKESRQKIVQRQRELPNELEADLYLCPKSIDAIKAALGTVCEAIDDVAASSQNQAAGLGTRAFVAVRPPGHHCVSGAPAGLGFVNNVMVGAVHSFYQHGYTHIVIFDTDLHHGNGTQQVVQQINEQRAKSKTGQESRPIMFFGSMHDIKSYPCSDQKPGTTAAALLCRSGEDGQWIENTMMVSWNSEDEFWKAYHDRYGRLITQAQRFIQTTKASPDKVMVLMSCGFAASLYEDPAVTSHGMHVPTAFYARFARDAAAFADRVAEGRLVSVLEGGYSNRALISGVMAHMAGLATDKNEAQEDWWSVEHLAEAEKLLKKQPGRKAKAEILSNWLGRTKQVASCLNEPLDMKGDSVVLEVPPPEPTLKQVEHPLALSADSVSKARPSKRAAATESPVSKAKRAKQGVPPSSSTGTTPSPHSGPSIGALSTPSSNTSVSTSQQPIPSSSADKAEASTLSPGSDVHNTYAEVSACLAALLSLVNANASTSASKFSPASSTITRAIRPLRGCIARLERILGDRTALLEALAVLEKLLEEAHRACGPLKGELESVDRAMYDLEGSVLDLRALCSDS